MDKKTTQLHSYHESKNAKFIDFGDWSMPFSYEGTLKEHDVAVSYTHLTLPTIYSV